MHIKTDSVRQSNQKAHQHWFKPVISGLRLKWKSVEELLSPSEMCLLPCTPCTPHTQWDLNRAHMLLLVKPQWLSKYIDGYYRNYPPLHLERPHLPYWEHMKSLAKEADTLFMMWRLFHGVGKRHTRRVDLKDLLTRKSAKVGVIKKLLGTVSCQWLSAIEESGFGGVRTAQQLLGRIHHLRRVQCLLWSTQKPLGWSDKVGAVWGHGQASLGGSAGWQRLVHHNLALLLQLDGSALPLGNLSLLTGHQAVATEWPTWEQKLVSHLLTWKVKAKFNCNKLMLLPFQLCYFHLKQFDFLLQFGLFQENAALDDQTLWGG